MKVKNVVKILKLARAKIEKQKNWTKRTQAENSKRDAVAVNSPEAVRWCAAGAVNAVTVTYKNGHAYYYLSQRHEALDYLTKNVPLGYNHMVTAYNDAPGTTHHQILKLFDRAIQAAEADLGSKKKK